MLLRDENNNGFNWVYLASFVFILEYMQNNFKEPKKESDWILYYLSVAPAAAYVDYRACLESGGMIGLVELDRDESVVNFEMATCEPGYRTNYDPLGL